MLVVPNPIKDLRLDVSRASRGSPMILELDHAPLDRGGTSKHGDAAVDLMLRTLRSGDTCDAGRMTSWHYFEVAFRRQAAATDKLIAMFAQRREAEATVVDVDEVSTLSRRPVTRSS